MIILPAIDLLDQQAVRLQKGAYDQVTVYAKDPVSLAQSFEETGATHLHVVDLEGARTGRPAHAALLEKIRNKTKLFIEVGGGIRTIETVQTLVDSGVQRIILGTAAYEDPAFLEECLARYGSQIAVGVDVRHGKVAVRGWLKDTDTDAITFCRKLAVMGVGAIIYTEISRDGMLQGVDEDAYRNLAEARGQEFPELVLIASGGLSSEGEIERLHALGMDGAILGKAMYEGILPLADALRAATDRR